MDHGTKLADAAAKLQVISMTDPVSVAQGDVAMVTLVGSCAEMAAFLAARRAYRQQKKPESKDT